MSDEEYLTVEEAAKRLKLHPETIRRWIRGGQIRAALLGSDRAGYRVPASEIELRLRGQRQLELPSDEPKKLAA